MSTISPHDRTELYKALLRRYRDTLDLLSDAAMDDLDALVADAEAYARVVEDLSPALHLDLGSGAGLPGVVIAAHRPEAPALFVERRRRRTAFLRICVSRLGLTGVDVVEADVRDLEGARVDVITAQAVADLASIYAWTCHLQADEVTLIARKGAGWAEEVAALEARVGAEADVLRRDALGRRGTLLALRLPGGLTCPSSG